MRPIQTGISQRIPPEQGIAPSGGVFCVAEYPASGKGQQTGGCCAVFSEPEAAVNGISGPRGGAHLNNLAENAIRPFTLGRKNWLFCDTPKGADASAVVYSLVESAKANGIEPFAYLQHVLVQLPYFGKSPSHEDLEALMPWRLIFSRNTGFQTPTLI